MDAGQFIQGVLSGLVGYRLPNGQTITKDNALTTSNQDFLARWIPREGTKAANNPLATTQSEPGATNFNSIGVKNYPTAALGIQATVKTLTNGHYNDILQGIASGNADTIDSNGGFAHGLSTWSGGAYATLRHNGMIANTAVLPNSQPITVVGNNLAPSLADQLGIHNPITSAVSGVESWLASGLARIAKILLGILLIIFGVIVIVQSSKVAEKAEVAASE